MIKIENDKIFINEEILAKHIKTCVECKKSILDLLKESKINYIYINLIKNILN
jgi:hypothetical protein